MGRINAAICDLDGIIFEFNKFMDLDTFYATVDKCIPIQSNVNFVTRLSKDNEILFVTARSEKVREITKDSLKKLFNFPIHLYMRKQGDLRPNYQVKEDILKELLKKYEITLALDDEEENLTMYRSYNIIVTA